MSDLFIQLSVGFFGVLLTVITGFIIKASGKMSILENTVEGMKALLANISSDLKITGKHDAQIAVLQTKVENIESDYVLTSQKIQEIERNAKGALRR